MQNLARGAGAGGISKTKEMLRRSPGTLMVIFHTTDGRTDGWANGVAQRRWSRNRVSDILRDRERAEIEMSEFSELNEPYRLRLLMPANTVMWR